MVVGLMFSVVHFLEFLIHGDSMRCLMMTTRGTQIDLKTQGFCFCIQHAHSHTGYNEILKNISFHLLQVGLMVMVFQCRAMMRYRMVFMLGSYHMVMVLYFRARLIVVVYMSPGFHCH